MALPGIRARAKAAAKAQTFRTRLRLLRAHASELRAGPARAPVI
jgi:hypothetical protein